MDRCSVLGAKISMREWSVMAMTAVPTPTYRGILNVSQHSRRKIPSASSQMRCMHIMKYSPYVPFHAGTMIAADENLRRTKRQVKCVFILARLKSFQFGGCIQLQRWDVESLLIRGPGLTLAIVVLYRGDNGVILSDSLPDCTKTSYTVPSKATSKHWQAWRPALS